MDSIDIVKFLNMFKTKKLKNVEAYGKVVKRLKPPSNLKGVFIERGGMFVQMDVFAVDLSNQASFLKELNIVSKDYKYMVNGSLMLYIDANTSVPDWFSTSGTLAISKSSDNNFLSNVNN